MRSALSRILGDQQPGFETTTHAGLLYERYAPLVYHGSEIGTLGVADREDLLERVASIGLPAIYWGAFRRWEAAVRSSGAAIACVETSGRLLVGHGNPAPTEVGLTLHHVYGVPFIPGSALKGLLNHYLADWGAAADEGWRGVAYDNDGRPVGAPGDYHGALFGAPNLPRRDGQPDDVGRRGRVVFEDAWLVPGSVADKGPLALDVVTPHQGAYYRQSGEEWPNDWTEPVPVTFLTVRPKVQFLVAVSAAEGDAEAASLALAHLLDALESWGIGAKTRAGYGHLRRADFPNEGERLPAGGRPEVVGADRRAPARTAAAQAARPPRPDSPALRAVEEAVKRVLEPSAEDAERPIAQRFREQFADDALLGVLTADERVHARSIILPLTQHRGLKRRCEPELSRLKEILNK